jgi:type IV pilus assembly protein PilW
MKTATVTAMRRRAGFTLVELMVALVIGLVLTLVVAQLFLGSRRTFATTDDVSRMQESMRFAGQILTRTAHQAGFRTSPNTKSEFIFAAPNLMLDGTEGAGPLPDSLTVRYQGNGAAGVNDDRVVVNCRGEHILPGVMSENRFTIENVPKVDAGVTVQVPSLVCRTDTDGFAGQYVVVSDVDNMKILYGEDTNADGSADRIDAKDSLVNINNVVALRIAMLFRSPNTATTTAVNTSTYTLNGKPIPAFNDTRARRDAVFTVGVRNRSL